MIMDSQQITLIAIIIIAVVVTAFVGINILKEQMLWQQYQQQLECSGILGWLKCALANFSTSVSQLFSKHKGSASIGIGTVGIAGCLGAIALTVGTGGIGAPALTVCGILGAGAGAVSYGLLGGTVTSFLTGTLGGIIAPVLSGIVFGTFAMIFVSFIFGVEKVFAVPYVPIFIFVLGFLLGLYIWQFISLILPMLAVGVVVTFIIFLYLKMKK